MSAADIDSLTIPGVEIDSADAAGKSTAGAVTSLNSLLGTISLVIGKGASPMAGVLPTTGGENNSLARLPLWAKADPTATNSNPLTLIHCNFERRLFVLVRKKCIFDFLVNLRFFAAYVGCVAGRWASCQMASSVVLFSIEFVSIKYRSTNQSARTQSSQRRYLMSRSDPTGWLLARCQTRWRSYSVPGSPQCCHCH